MVYCTAFNCKNDGKSLVSFFQFPTNEKYRKIWMKKVRRVDWEPTEHSRLCSAHFESHCFQQKLKLLESLGLPPPKKLILKPGAIPTIFDYEDRSSKSSKSMAPSRKRKSIDETQTEKPKAKRQRKIIEVIDFGSLLDEYLKGLESKDKAAIPNSERGSAGIVDEIIPGSSLCEGGDKFVLLLNKPLLEDTQGLPLVARFGSAHVVPVTSWKDVIIQGENIPKCDSPGTVLVQLETNDGSVLGSATFTYREEITTGLQKIVLNKNYSENLLDAFSQRATRTEGDSTVGTSATGTEMFTDVSNADDSSLTSVLRLMLYIAAKNKANQFMHSTYRTRIGKEVLLAFQKKGNSTGNAVQSAVQSELTSFIVESVKRFVDEELKAAGKEKESLAKNLEKKEQAQICKNGQQTKSKPTKCVKNTKSKDKMATFSKKTSSTNDVHTVYPEINSKTNSLLLLSDIALRHLNSEVAEMNGLKDSASAMSLDPSSATEKDKGMSCSQKRNTQCFSRKVVLLPRGSTCLPTPTKLSKLRKTPENWGSLQLDIDMTATEVLSKVRKIFGNVGKKRIRLAAADSNSKLDFFKSTKWTAKTLRQRIRMSSILYVVPSK